MPIHSSVTQSLILSFSFSLLSGTHQGQDNDKDPGVNNGYEQYYADDHEKDLTQKDMRPQG